MALPFPRSLSGEKLARLLLFAVMVFVFLVAIKLFGHSVKAFGQDAAAGLFEGLENPFAGLAVGILATVLVQSSSVTTSTVVAMVGSGVLPLQYAVLGISGKPLACVLLVVALAMIVVSLILITRNMRSLMADRIEVWLNRILRRSGLLGLAIGMLVTMLEYRYFKRIASHTRNIASSVVQPLHKLDFTSKIVTEAAKRHDQASAAEED